MNKNKVINSMYLIPALLEALKGNKEDYILDVLKEFEIENIEEYRDLDCLLKYHYKIVVNDFKTDDDLYNLLRQGLDQYFKKYLKDFWKEVGVTGTDKKLLDYGGGDGSYSLSFKNHNPEGTFFLLDRSTGIDFEKDPLWFEPWEHHFDIVLLSEILHCKEIKLQKYLIKSSLKVLKPGGMLIINENEDPFMNWRLKKLTSEGKTLNLKYIMNLLSKVDVKLNSFKKINYHNIFIYDKI